MLAGFRVTSKYEDLDLKKITISNLKEKHFINEDKMLLKQLIGDIPKEILPQLDIESTFRIEIAEGDFFVIKDFLNGNYLSINKSGAIYEMIHDPYQVNKIFDNKNTFFKALMSGDFNFEKYFLCNSGSN